MIEILDLGINNLSSISRAFISSSSEDSVQILEEPGDYAKKSLMVLPGLGSFSSGMLALQDRGLDQYIIHKVKSGSHLVGICLGMQLLGDTSQESPGIGGLALIRGESKLLNPHKREKVPHIGWNDVSPTKDVSSLGQLHAGKDFYFVHSYHFCPEDAEDELTVTPFGEVNFTSAVMQGRVVGFQFHPEKSGSGGRNLISQIIQWSNNEE
jgi:imidazole glycerol phosphate synthase glutamine amidotransferase subunit